MEYITGIQALNIEDSTECSGDWHRLAIYRDNLDIRESNESIFKDYGIEPHKEVPFHEGTYNVANTLRAILDLFEQNKLMGWLKGFRNDFICTDIYNQEFLEKVQMLRGVPHWKDINSLMEREFMWDWVNFLKEKGA